jgi:hypothetical protein
VCGSHLQRRATCLAHLILKRRIMLSALWRDGGGTAVSPGQRQEGVNLSRSPIDLSLFWKHLKLFHHFKRLRSAQSYFTMSLKSRSPPFERFPDTFRIWGGWAVEAFCKSCLCWESNLNFSAVQPAEVAVATELSRFLLTSTENKNEARILHFAMTAYRGPEGKDISYSRRWTVRIELESYAA